MKKFHLLFVLIAIQFHSFAQDSISFQLDSNQIQELFALQNYYDSIEKSFTYQTGNVELTNGKGTLTVPKGFKYLDPTQSNTVLTDLWGNPPSTTLGMIFPEEFSPVSDSLTYAIEISYSADGHIDDEDAMDIDYDDLLSDMKKDSKSNNEERAKQGYPKIELVGWASEPYYDYQNKRLHWAKELKFDETEINTLNYNVIILGREGYFNMNIISDMNQLSTVQKDMNKIIPSIEFKEGHTYSDFDPEIDKLAAVGIGGLVAGKVLSKVGFFALIAKFWKFIAIGAVAVFTAFKNKIFGGK